MAKIMVVEDEAVIRQLIIEELENGSLRPLARRISIKC